MSKIFLRFCTLSHAARTDALTMREWDALARTFGEMEAEGAPPISLAKPEMITSDDVRAALKVFSGYIRKCVINRLGEAGLDPSEWIVTVLPEPISWLQVAARRWSWEILRWHVDVQLLPERSAAKSAVTDKDHAPTLSEQHGGAKGEGSV